MTLHLTIQLNALGAGGYSIDVQRNTDLVGAVIASSASDTSRNTLTTGTLTARDVQNRETYSASSTNLSGGLSVAVGGTPALHQPPRLRLVWALHAMVRPQPMRQRPPAMCRALTWAMASA